jgi:uncharacterized damage-inducible protein DinB
MPVMADSAFLEESIALLERTPRVVRALLEDLPEGWLTERDTAAGWQARDVVGHLISAEMDDWIPRAEIILRDGTTRPFTPFDRFQHEQRDVGVPLAQLIDRFAQLRAAGIERLRELVTDDSDLDRRGMHPELGEVTLRQHIATWTVHDLDHVAQIYSALAAARDAQVGPWKQYLGILLRRDAAV